MASAAAHTLIEAVPAAVADPGMTAIWEQALDEIEAGRLTLDAFVAKQAHWITQLVEHSGALTLSVPVEAGPHCPICNASMLRRKGKIRTVLVMLPLPELQRHCADQQRAASTMTHRW
nr:hypothetical protein GCM10020185_00680 [Pseudomonas brassicacearum subsp. brassicacearum]